MICPMRRMYIPLRKKCSLNNGEQRRTDEARDRERRRELRKYLRNVVQTAQNSNTKSLKPPAPNEQHEDSTGRSSSRMDMTPFLEIEDMMSVLDSTILRPL